MKISRIGFALIISVAVAFSCTQGKKQMTIEDYYKIDTEVITTDMKPESIKKVSEKYGFTPAQYEEFSNRVAADPELMEKLGRIRLGEQKNIR